MPIRDLADQISLFLGPRRPGGNDPPRDSRPSPPCVTTPSTTATTKTAMAPPSPADRHDAPAATGPDACPVDHKSREAWLSQARSAAAAAAEPAMPPNHPPARGAAAESCPVDHNAREAWLRQAREASAAAGNSTPAPPPAAAPSPPPPGGRSSSSSSSSWTASLTSWLPSFSSSARSTPQTPAPPPPTAALSETRVVSTIPRAGLDDARAAAAAAGGGGSSSSHAPANREQETGADARSGNWIYPSEKMFFEAMKRKGHDPQAPDMRSVVPIHNAVNERAWAEIKGWEGPYVEGTSCQGPRLTSFSGLSTKLSPKARFNTLLGYSAPFDRHDWIVDRCGKEIEYVIDFYAGRPAPDGKPSFYLDVRPKLNSWEGVKMRAMRGLGVM